MRGSVKLVQVKGPNTNWESMNNVWGASWELGQSPQPPLDIRIQDDQGQEVRQYCLFWRSLFCCCESSTVSCMGANCVGANWASVDCMQGQGAACMQCCLNTKVSSNYHICWEV